MATDRFAGTPEPPYFVVLFSSQRTPDDNGYAQTADRVMELARRQPGFLGAESTRDASGFGITVSYWASLEAIANWKANEEHRGAQTQGQKTWYSRYELRVCKVERADGFCP
jgi:heme-degrading monooxygenase HmoA